MQIIHGLTENLASLPMPWELGLEPNATTCDCWKPCIRFPYFPLLLHTFISSRFPIFPCSYAVYIYGDRMHSSLLGFHDSKVHYLQIFYELSNSLKMNGGPGERLHHRESYLPPSPWVLFFYFPFPDFVFLFPFLWHRQEAALLVSQSNSTHALG